MGTSISRHAFVDCFDLMDKAIEDDKGIKIKFADNGDASNFRLRLYAARRIDRRENSSAGGERRSAYDGLYITIRPGEGGVYLHLEKTSARLGELEIESLSEGDEDVATT